MIKTPKCKDDITPILDANEDTNYVFLDEKNEATFFCKNCGNVVTRGLSSVIHAQTAVRVRCKCKCGHLFRVLVDRRRNYRKTVKLLGMCLYVKCSGHIKRRLITILDISSSGLHFSIYGRPEFKLRDKIIVQVRLDDRENTEVKGKGFVRRIRSNSVGIEFISNDHPGKLHFYLRR
jgi:hypothetical protein